MCFAYRDLHKDQTTLLLYLLLHRNPNVASFILSRTDIDNLVSATFTSAMFCKLRQFKTYCTLWSVMQFIKNWVKEFDWLSGHGIWAIIPCPTNMVSVRVILGRFCFYFSLLFCILGAFLIEQLFYSRLLDMRWL